MLLSAPSKLAANIADRSREYALFVAPAGPLIIRSGRKVTSAVPLAVEVACVAVSVTLTDTLYVPVVTPLEFVSSG